MISRGIHFVIGTFLLLFLFSAVQAHVPIIPNDNNNLEVAEYIHDPLKSWVIYGQLEGEDADYYRFDMEKGQKLYLMLFTPDKNTFTPGLAIMGPGITSQGTIPAFIDIPPGSGVMAVAGKRPDQASYEPFTPARIYERIVIDMKVNADGPYYVAVFEPSAKGRYGLAVGYREKFEVYEWIRVPLDVIAIHQWEGQSLGFILAPMLAIIAIGFVFLIWQRETRKYAPQSLSSWIASIAAFSYLGSGAMMFMQMGIALGHTDIPSSVVITVIFALLPIIAGIAMLYVSMKAVSGSEMKARVTMAILGILGLFIWAGLFIGPVLAILASFLPLSIKERT
jgi:hypothetical protein